MKKLVLFGDSIFNGYMGGLDTNRVTKIFERRLPGVQIKNISVSGGTTSQGLGLLDQVPRDADQVIVEYGTNDAASGWGIPVDNYRKNLDRIVKTLGPDHCIIVGPSYPDPDNAEIMLYYTTKSLNEYDAAALSVAQKYGRPFVDLIAAMRKRQNYSRYYQSDGQHLTDAGNELLVGEIMKKIKQ